jgi:hypothetical protein
MLGTKRALNKAIRRLGISRSLTSWQWVFFVKEAHSAIENRSQNFMVKIRRKYRETVVVNSSTDNKNWPNKMDVSQ